MPLKKEELNLGNGKKKKRKLSRMQKEERDDRARLIRSLRNPSGDPLSEESIMRMDRPGAVKRWAEREDGGFVD